MAVDMAGTGIEASHLALNIFTAGCGGLEVTSDQFV